MKQDNDSDFGIIAGHKKIQGPYSNTNTRQQSFGYIETKWIPN